MRLAFLFMTIPALFFGSSGNTGFSDTSRTHLTPTFQKVREKHDRKYNDIARYIAGMLPEKECKLDSSLLNNPNWKLYHDTSDAKWKNYYAERIITLREWSYEELGELNSKRFKFFYPFSGPDILHGNMFFQNADTTIMFGLEAVGIVPFLTKITKDSANNYIKSINHSLYAVLNYSFFRTISMRKELTDKEAGGTLPVIMLLLQRTGNRILDVKHIHLDPKGAMVFDGKAPSYTANVPGVEITYCREDSTHEAKLYYFKVDISNKALLNKNPEFNSYLKKMGNVYTMIKSASYLMHNDNFSLIRSIIIKQSQIVLQDDSGIPHQFFIKNNFDPFYYGKYTGVISLFASRYQPLLDKAYKTETGKVEPISFGIGYKYHPGESNWVLYRKIP
jgi:hypothetical protein